MPDTVVTKDLRVRAYFDAQTGQLKVYEADMDKIKKAVDKAAESTKRHELAVARQQRALNNVRDSITSSTSALGSMGGVLGKTAGQLLQVTNQFEDLEYAQQRAGKSINLMTASVGEASGALGNLGIAGLVVGAAIGGWKIGTWINQLFEMGKPIEHIDKTTGELIVKTDEWGERIALLGKLALPVFAAIAWAAKQAGDAIGGGMGINMKDVMTQTEASKQLAALMARRVANLKTQAATDQFTSDLLLKNKLKEMAATEETNKKQAESTKKKYDELKRLEEEYHKFLLDSWKKESDAYAELLEDRKIKDLQEIHDMLDKRQQVWQDSIDKEKQAQKDLQNWVINSDHTVSDNFRQMAEENGKAIEELTFKVESFGEALMRIGGIAGGLEGIFSELGNAIGGALGETIGGIGSAIGGAGQAAFGIGQLFSGDILGGIQNAIAGIGKLVKALKDLFGGHDWGKDAKNVLIQFGLIGGVSDSLAKSLTELAKKMKDAGSATVVMLGDIMSEKGLNAANFSFYINTLIYGFEKGKQSAEQLAKTIANVFPQMADFAIQYGGVFIDQLALIIDQIAKTGIGIETLQTYFDELKAKINEIRSAALTDLIAQIKSLGDEFAVLMKKMEAKGIEAGGTKETWEHFLSAGDLNLMKHRFNELQIYFTDTVAAMKAQGKSWAEIFTAMGPVWQQLIDAAKRFGFEASKAFKQITLEMKIFKEHVAEFEHLDLVSKITADLLRLNALTKSQFQDLERTIANLWKNVTHDLTVAQIQHSAQGRAAISAMLPYLIQVLGIHNMTGMAITAQDRLLIQLAQHYGLLPKSAAELAKVGLDPQYLMLKNMLAVLELIAKALGVTQAEINGVTDAARKAAESSHQAATSMKNDWDAVYDSAHAARLEIEKMGNTNSGKTSGGTGGGDNGLKRPQRNGDNRPHVNHFHFYGSDRMKLRETIRQLERDGEL